MRDELAEIVIEASKLGMAQAIAQKGWQKGIQGSYVRKKGAPPKTRGAWVAGLIVDDLFRQAGADKHAVALV